MSQKPLKFLNFTRTVAHAANPLHDSNKIWYTDLV